ncbi:peptidylprolyl isomerase [bacterium]|nr:peptidylprolyl isomerase [bacterium]
MLLSVGAVAAQPSSDAAGDASAETETVVVLKTVQGDIYLRFFPELAPEHVKNFIFHAKEGNYTDTYFHRVIPGMMIQGGDFNSKDDNPANDGMGGWSYKGPGTHLPAEFSDRKHVRGILSMARGGDPNSAGSQFFIMHAPYPSLNGKYTVFGEVIKGLDVVDKIVTTDRDRRNNRPDENQAVTEVEVLEWSKRKVDVFLLEQKTIETTSPH